MQYKFLWQPKVLLLIVFLILTGCQLLRPYRWPVTPTPNEWKGSYDAQDAGQPTIPQQWKQETQSQDSQNTPEQNSLNALNEEAIDQDQYQEPSYDDVRRDLCNWWEIFNDPVLNQLEEQALNSSYTLWAALERVIQARAIARINFAPLLPGINFAPSFTRTGSLFQNPFPGLGQNNRGMCPSSSSANINPPANIDNLLGDVPKSFRFVQTQYLLPLNLNYEVDLWSQLNNAYYAELIRAQAASQAYLSILLSLTADIASTYFDLRGLDAQLEVIQGNIRVRQNAVDINKARFNAGLIVYLDVSRAQVELSRARSDWDNTSRIRGLKENLLATLVGTPASVFSLEFDPVRIPPPVIPRGLPSELLCRRPDIGEAERNLAAAYRDIGVAYANFFPSLSLNAAIGLESPFAKDLFSWKARFWQVGFNILQTVFDAGRNQANLDYYRARFCEAMANYQETVLEAFQDVEDALVNLKQYAQQALDLSDAVKAARITLELAQLRYNRGLINYLDVVDAERQLLETEQNSVIVLGNRYISTVMLIRALGGGWGPCQTCQQETETCFSSDEERTE